MTYLPPAGVRNDDLDELLRLAAPIQDRDVCTAAVRAAVTGVAQAVIAAPPEAVSAGKTTLTSSSPVRRPPVRRRRKLVSLSLASTIWALSATGAASAGGYALYSGFLDNDSSTESVRGEEYVNVASPEFGAAFDRIAEGHPLPAGADYTRLYDNIVDTGGLRQLTGTAGQVVFHSICAWSAEWVRAHEADDSQAERNAVVELERAVSSPDLAAIDGGGVVDSMTAVAQAAAAADTAAVTTFVGGADCTGLRR